MAFMQLYSVIIEFAGSELDRRQWPTYGCVIHLAEKQTGTQRSFAFYEEQKPVYTLNEDEVAALLSLLGQITVRAPWDAMWGFDGAACTLRLEGPMSHAEFSWWVEVPKGWESIGMVFGHVTSLAKRHGCASALCG